MFKKTMKFDDLDGEEVEQTFYFNYTKKEVAELIEFGAIQEFADPNKEYMPLEEMLKKLSTPTSESGLSNTENNRQAYDIFQNLILDAYGQKASDNRGFNKSVELRTYLKNHLAFVEMIWEFIGNPAEAAKFIESCLPPKLVAASKAELQRENEGKLTSETITEMVQEAARRQEDPETRIEPGIEAAREALGEQPEIEQLAEVVKIDTGEEKGQDVEDLTPDEILNMDQVSFDKLDTKKLSKDQLLAAFKRKSSS